MHSDRRLAVYLGLLTALSALSTDMILPGLSQVTRDFNADPAVVQLVLSAFMVGYGMSQLIYGPLSDRWGRRPILLAGLSLYALAGCLCALSASAHELVFFRFLQGVGACAGPVLARAIVRDRYTGNKAAAVLSTVTFLFGLAPLIAPIMGSIALSFADWRATFWVLAVIGAVALLITWRRYEETAPLELLQQRNRGWTFGDWVGAAIAPFRHPDTRRSCIVVVSCYCGIVLHVGGTPLVMIEMMGVSPTGFAAYFALTGAFLMAGAMVNGRLLRHIGAAGAMRWGCRLTLLSAFAMLAAGWWLPLSPWALTIPMGIFAFSTSLLLPNGMSAALTPFPHIAGTVSAALGTVQVVSGAFVVYLIGVYHGAGTLSLGIGLLISASVCMLAYKAPAARLPG